MSYRHVFTKKKKHQTKPNQLNSIADNFQLCIFFPLILMKFNLAKKKTERETI